MSRKTESKKAARVLREVFDAKLPVPGVTTRDRDAALWLAITILEARAQDADSEEG
jgi:hypothetical protein